MAQSIALFWRALAKHSKSGQGIAHIAHIAPSPEFRRVLAGERARADRGREELCLVTFRAKSASQRFQLAGVVSDWLDQPNHGLNRAGWLSRDRLAIVLPATSDETAEAIAQRLSRACENSGPPAEWRVDTYPHKRLHRTSVSPASHREVQYAENSLGADSGNCAVLSEAPPAVSTIARSDDDDRNPITFHIAPYLQKVTICPCPPWKRLIDLLGASVGLLLLSPILVTVAAYIKCVSKGPVFFRQRRYGFAGRPFTLWKFRTLEIDEAASTQCSHVIDLMASDRPLEKRDHHLAVIPGGALLRKLGLDELPQLFNVLKGEMSLVGPRPDVVPFKSYAIWQRRRFDVVPGITGLWQVSGKNQTTFATMMRMDISYVRQRSLLLDLMILLRTIPTVLSK
jgi:lipopolysaccharide/colanic/teichoic acid biosynthesis glycosyltransferase